MNDLQDKLIRRRRGGYCFEQGLLFAAALERVGFRVERLIARVNPRAARPGPRTHMLAKVSVEGQPWIADIGFGVGLLEPIPLVPDDEINQGGWRYKLQRHGAEGWLLIAEETGEFADMYAFTLEEQQPVDFALANHYTATYPRSPFISKPVAFRNDPDTRYRLRGTAFSIERVDGTVEKRTVPPEALSQTLSEVFRIELDDEDRQALQARWSTG